MGEDTKLGGDMKTHGLLTVFLNGTERCAATRRPEGRRIGCRKGASRAGAGCCASLGVVATAALVVGLAPPASAQDEGADDMVEEIIVTARKREDTLQEVPLSVTAFTTEHIEERNFRDLQDVSQETSGLVYENFATAGLSTAAVIRGMGQTFTTARIQNTAVFLDGVYLQRQSMINPGLMDLERVEIVKGPQNSQFGRNAFSGVVNYVTKRSEREFAADLSATYGSGGRLDARASASFPVAEDTLYLRLAAGTSTLDGHTDNDHPLAGAGPSGHRRYTDDRVGGWNDGFRSASVHWTPGLGWDVELGYYRTDTNREPQAYYDLNGARYAYDTAEFGGPPTFAFLAPLGTNCNETITFSSRAPFPARGPHAFCGELPTSPPALPDPKLEAAGFGGMSGRIAIDPRSLAVDASSTITRLKIDYDLDETLALSYQFGYVEHEADGFGTVEGRASLVGSSVAYVPVRETPFPPFVTQLGPPGSLGAIAQASTFNATPSEALESTSHELRLTRSTDELTLRVGAYRSQNDDEDGGTFFFVPPCSDAASCGTPVPTGTNPLSGRFIAVVPVVPGVVHIGIPHFFDTGHAVLGNQVSYEDTVSAVFGDLEWRVSDRTTLALEARYTSEDKSFQQFSTTFGAAMPDNVAASDEQNFTFFTPRLILERQLGDASMVYGLVAQGVKTGGFNAVDPAANPGQAVYDEEQNTTFEVGTKNRFLDGRLTLNAALYVIDWSDVQGSEAAASPDAWTNDVVGNIGDASVTGLEIDGWLRATDNVSIDYHLGYSNAEYEDAVYLSSVAGPNSSWGCNGSVCRADGRVDGNQVERTAKWQYGAGLNVGRSLANDWRFGARIDFNYRSKMYATPMNLAHNGDRMLANANASLGNGVLGFVLWGRNILDEEYVANSFVLPSFTRYIVGLGARRTIGLTASYNM